MQFSTFLALAPLALAAPLVERSASATYTIISTSSHDPTGADAKHWVIRDNGIFLSGKTGAQCIPGDPCENYSNNTAFYSETGYHIGVNLNAASKQYLFALPSGALSYNPDFSADWELPAGSFVDDFSYEPTSAFEGYGLFGFVESSTASGFMNCDGQIYATVDGGDYSNCIDTEAFTSPYSGYQADFYS